MKGRPPWSSSARAPVEQAVHKASLKAEKRIAKQLNVSAKDVDNAIRESAGELG